MCQPRSRQALAHPALRQLSNRGPRLPGAPEAVSPGRSQPTPAARASLPCAVPEVCTGPRPSRRPGLPGSPSADAGPPSLIEVTADSGFPRFAASQHGFVSGLPRHSARKPARTQNQGAWERRPPSACRRQGTQARGLTQEACPGHRRSSRSPHPLSGSEGSTERPSPGSAASTGRGVSTTPDSAQARGLH